MNRVRKSFKRTSGVRDAKLIIIACEGEITEKQYFNGVAYSEEYKNPKVRVKVLNRGSSNSDPKESVRSLNKFKKTYKLNRYDELWLICDVDRWGAKKIAEVNRLCKQKKYFIAVSNPCFEFWLFLHHVNLSEYSEDQLMSLSSCKRVCSELKTVLGRYNKINIDIVSYIDSIEHAMTQAQLLCAEELDWPNEVGSNVYKLMQSIINS